jgi:hypothetical protein
MRVLATVRASGLPDAWVGAGAQRGYHAQAPATSPPLKRSNKVCAAAFVPSTVLDDGILTLPGETVTYTTNVP